MGTCVQCNTNDDCDATHGCDPTMHACVAIVPGSKDVCQPCLRDSECHVGQLCAAISATHPATGNFCTWRVDPMVTGPTCLMVRPYVLPMMLTSVDGVSANMCLLRSSTCEALHEFAQTCATPSTTPSPMCGASMTGYCSHQGALTECTVLCANALDCPCADPACMTQYQCNSTLCNLTSTCTFDPPSGSCR
jgi:hypothetical protein